MTKPILLQGLTAFSVAQILAADTTATPNIVIIFIDDMGYADIGPFGATKQRTPSLDRICAMNSA